jgi:spore coat polysaccharide biosynthesis protein SpsF
MSAVAAIVQARMGSSRLPGKSIAKVYKDFSLLEMVLLRVLKAIKLDLVILATSEEKDCDPLEKISSRIGVIVVRGSETDVLSRFVKAINIYKPRAVVRVCADNPLIAPGEIDKLVTFFEDNSFDYVANNTPECGLPDGLGCEIVRADLLAYIANKTEKQEFREHVTSYITSHQEKFLLGSLKADQNLWYPELKLDIDTQADLEKMQRFCSLLPEDKAPYWTAYEIVMNAKSMSAA